MLCHFPRQNVIKFKDISLTGSDISPSQHLARIDVGILRKKKVNRNDLVAADISVTLAIQRSE